MDGTTTRPGARARARSLRLAAGALAVAAIATLGPLAGPSAAQDPADAAALDAAALEAIPELQVPLRPILPGGRREGFVPPRDSNLRALPKRSDIRVTYHGFGPNGRAAFEYAVSIWERMVSSPVPIEVDATWGSYPGVLAQAGPSNFLRQYPNAPRTDSWYPVALANARAGRDLRPGETDIEVEVSSAWDWYTGTNGMVGSGQFDLVTAVLHELGHGLGISDSFVSDGYYLDYGGGTLIPFAYDRYVVDGAGNRLLDQPYAGGGAKVTSDDLWFSGGQARGATAFGRVKLYAPGSYSSSSIAHLDEGTYPAGNANALMTPQGEYGFAIHDPGDIALGMLRDIGWSTTPSKFTPAPAPSAPIVAAGNGTVKATWSAPSIDRGLIRGYRVQGFEGFSDTPLFTTDVGRVTSRRFSGLTNGTGYRFRVAAITDAGPGAWSGRSAEARPLDIRPFDDVDEFLGRQYLDILYRGPSASAAASRRAQLNTGAVTPGRTVVELMGDATHLESVPPTIRLYLAYFQRLPDEGGLAYWAGKARGGTSLAKASEQFSRSSEFLRTYGSLSNGQFVDLVYQNVLGRLGDSEGRTYWIRKLNAGTPRGTVMIQFSESSEHRRKTQSKVDAVSLTHVLLRRIPSSTELDSMVARLGGGTSLATLAAEILASSAYWSRVG